MKLRLLIAGLRILVNFIHAIACTIIAVGKKATSDNSIIISHTDNGPDSRIYVMPAKAFKTGEKAPVYRGIQDASLPMLDDGEILDYIPQAEKTYKYFHSAYSHVNEYQLSMVSMIIIFTGSYIRQLKN